MTHATHEVNRQEVLVELAEVLADMLDNNTRTKERKAKGSEEKVTVPAPAKPTDSEYEAIGQLIGKCPSLIFVSMGQQNVVDLPKEGKDEWDKISQLRAQLRAAEAEFEKNFPQLKEGTKLNEAAKEMLSVVYATVSGRPVPYSVKKSLRTFLPDRYKEDEEETATEETETEETE